MHSPTCGRCPARAVAAIADHAGLANGLPRAHKLNLGFRVIGVCAAATACGCALSLAWSFTAAAAVLAPLVFVPLYAAAEAAFAFWARARWQQYTRLPHDAQPATSEEARRVFGRTMDALGDSAAGTPSGVGRWLSTWLFDVTLRDVRRPVLLELLAYAFWLSDRCASGHDT